MVTAILPGREPLGPHGVRYGEEGVVRWMVTAILAGHGPHGVRYGEKGVVRWMVTAILADHGLHETGYGESGVASSGGHIVRSCRLL